jgi:hypothetical protein
VDARREDQPHLRACLPPAASFGVRDRKFKTPLAVRLLSGKVVKAPARGAPSGLQLDSLSGEKESSQQVVFKKNG